MHTLPVINIALADDHMLILEGLANLIHDLDSHFNVCIQAAGGKELLDKISDADIRPDICLIDIHMPGMDGYETMQEVSRRWPGIKVITLSIDIDDYAILRSLKCGARSYLSKNVHPNVVKEAILEVYNNEYYFSDLILKKFPKMTRKNIKDHTKKMLTDSQVKFLQLCCTNMTYEEIAIEMHLSRRTIEKYCSKLKDIYGIHSRVGLVKYALYTGIGVINTAIFVKISNTK